MRILRDRLLGPLYWLRRTFLLRTRRFPLTEAGQCWCRVDDARAALPHGPVRLRVLEATDWGSVELRGLGARDEPRGGWCLWFERPRPGQELTLDLPYGLRDLSLRLHGGSEVPRWVEISERRLPRRSRQSPAQSLVPTAAAVNMASGDYPSWIATYESPSPESRLRLAERARESGLRGEVLLLAAGAGGREEGVRGLSEGVRMVRRLEDAESDFVLTVPQGALLVPHALDAVACAFSDHPEALVVHADDDLVGTDGRRFAPSFKPTLSPELLRARNYLDGLVAFRRSALPADRRGPLDPASRYGLLLDLTTRGGEQGILRLPAVLVSLPSRETDGAGERRVLTGHLTSRGIVCEVLDGVRPGWRHVRYALPDPPPRVSIIIPTRNARSLVETCIRSVRRLTDYPSFEIVLVDNGSDEPASLATFDALATEGLARLTRDPGPFNFAALNNRAVAAASAEFVCLMNNDVEVVHADWLTEMVGVAVQPGVGAVGAKLLFPDGRVQHAGVLVGYRGVADHLYARAPGDAEGMDAQLRVRREVSAVTAACLVVSRSVYQDTGGLDERTFSVGYNDVDFCLKLRARGLRNIWTPHARLLHHESATRGRPGSPDEFARLARETEALRARWHTDQFEDPFHSPNLSNDSLLPALAFPPRRRPWAVGCGS
jgi:GT2 family glycosyltransferase